MTAGDVDADWEEAYAVGDEAPGGDNPTPDQDRVDDIGKALGVEYRGQRRAEGFREDHRTRQAPVGAGPGVVRGLSGQGLEGFPLPASRCPLPASGPDDAGSGRLFVQQPHDRVDHTVDRQRRRVNLHRIVGAQERGGGSRAVATVARFERRRDLGERRAGAAGAVQRVERPPAGALLRGGVQEILRSASGKTTVPMSRPSMTTPPSRPSARCITLSVSRTRGSRATAAAAASISGVRIAAATSSPSTRTAPSPISS